MSKRTPAQKERQHDEYRDHGKYAKVNECEVCGKSSGVKYYSHENTDDWGCALVICKKCIKSVSSLETLEEFEAYVASKRS